MAYSDDGIVRVLLVDDDEQLRTLITHLLLAEGCQVVPVDSAEAGLEQLPYGRFDVAFVDHHLPGMEGLVFGEYLRQNNPDMHIALVTGDPERNLERAARDQNIAFIEKPFEPSQLFAVIDASKASALERERHAKERAAPSFVPHVEPHLDALAGFYTMPRPPARLVTRLGQRVREALSDLHHGHFNEELRATAFAGLLCARVLGLRLPAWSPTVSLEQMYDQIMADHGCRTEFTQSDE